MVPVLYGVTVLRPREGRITSVKFHDMYVHRVNLRTCVLIVLCHCMCVFHLYNDCLVLMALMRRSPLERYPNSKLPDKRHDQHDHIGSTIYAD